MQGGLGKAQWYRQGKDAVFLEPKWEHIHGKRIGDKIANMEKAYKKAKADQDQSRWGLTGADCETCINGRVHERE